jgi:selenide,water dikinase
MKMTDSRHPQSSQTAGDIGFQRVPPLTSLSRFCGCGAKMPLAMLETMLSRVPPMARSGLVDFTTRDDCAIYPQGRGRSLLFTMDIITPVANDAHTFGQIAAANALSDIYATGGSPMMALSFLSFPVGQLDDAVATEIQRGAATVLALANCPLVGGHTLDDRELKFGLAVIGSARNRDLLPNSAAEPGHLLVLTKPLGNGVIIKALKDGIWKEEQFSQCRNWMIRLNAEGLSVGRKLGARSCVDVTGYGLAGHAIWMARASGVALEISVSRLPVLDGVLDLIRAGCIPRGAKNNRAFLESEVGGLGRLTETLKWLLFDPQTSGGLLLAIPGEKESRVRAFSKQDGVPTVIGRVVRHTKKGPRLHIVP